jgi:hypothetical protein
MEKYQPFLHLTHTTVAGNSINRQHWTYSDVTTAFAKIPHYINRAVLQLSGKKVYKLALQIIPDSQHEA